MRSRLNNLHTAHRMTFSLACSYSGHTLLALLLDSNPELTHLGDTISIKKSYRQKKCSCGQASENCEFWRRVFAWEGFSPLRTGFSKNYFLSAAFYSPSFSPFQKALVWSTPKIREYANTLLSFSSFVKKTNKSTDMIYGRKRICDPLLLISCGYNVKIIHITKSPIAYVASCLKRQNKASTRYFPGKNYEDIAKQWVSYNSRVFKCQSLGAHYIHIRYEDLCCYPEHTMQQLCNFLSVEYNKAMLHPEKLPHHLIGSASITNKPFQGIQIQRLEEHVLSKKEKDRIRELTSVVARKLGYS